MARGGPGAGPGQSARLERGSWVGAPGPPIQGARVGPLLRSPHSQCLLSRCRSEGESSRSIRYVSSASVCASVRLPWAGGIGKTMCFSSRTRSGGWAPCPAPCWLGVLG